MVRLVLLLAGLLASAWIVAGRAMAHFALIRPEADPATEQTSLQPGADWLRRPKTNASRTGSAASALSGRGGKKVTAETRVTPLRRDRPKREVDPPKTRRRKLGW